MTENKKLKVRWRVQLRFKIEIHLRDKDLINKIQAYFKVSSIIQSRTRDSIRFQVSKPKDLRVVIYHFNVRRFGYSERASWASLIRSQAETLATQNGVGSVYTY